MIYSGVLPDATLAELTTPEAIEREGRWRSEHSMRGVLIAEEPAGDGQLERMVGFAAFGPERGEDDEKGLPYPEPDEVPDRAELYAIYVVPDHWSTGTGHKLMDGVLALAAGTGYSDISLWVVEANERARRFYELSGFQVTGESAVVGGMGGISEIRYRRLVD